MFFKHFWRALVCSAVILLLSCTPGDSFKKITFWNIIYADKIAHLAMYFSLTIYLKYGLTKHFSAKTLFYMPMLISFSYGGILEIIQHFFISGRSGDIIDLIFNSTGIILAYLTYNKLEKKKLIL